MTGTVCYAPEALELLRNQRAQVDARGFAAQREPIHVATIGEEIDMTILTLRTAPLIIRDQEFSLDLYRTVVQSCSLGQSDFCMPYTPNGRTREPRI
jgi:hypothetical protein